MWTFGILSLGYAGVLVLDALLVDTWWVQWLPVLVASQAWVLGLRIAGERRARRLEQTEVVDLSMPRALGMSLWLLLLLGAVFGGAIVCGAFFVLYAAADQIQEMVRWRRLDVQLQPSA